MPDTIRKTGLCSVVERRLRSTTEAAVELREDDDTAEKRFTGHAAIFNSRTEIGNALRWGWLEEIAPTAFDKTLQEEDQRFLVDHDTRLLVARVSAGDLTLASDGVGLLVDAGLDTELSYVRDLVRNLEKRRITGMSFGFQVVRDTWSTVSVEVPDPADPTKTRSVDVELRVLEEVRLLEVSAVTFPAYEDTDAGLRARAQEVRDARGVPLISPSEAWDDDPAPAEEATRGDDGDAPAGLATRLRELRLREASAERFHRDHPMIPTSGKDTP